MPTLREKMSVAQLESWFAVMWLLLRGDPDDLVPPEVEALVADLQPLLDQRMLQYSRSDENMAECCFQLWAFMTTYLSEQQWPTQTLTDVGALTATNLALLASKPYPAKWFGADDRFRDCAPVAYQPPGNVDPDAITYVLNTLGRQYAFARHHDQQIRAFAHRVPVEINRVELPPPLSGARLQRLTQHWWPLLHNTYEHRVDYAFVASHLQLVDIYRHPLFGNEFRMINGALGLARAEKQALNTAVFAHNTSTYYDAHCPEGVYGLGIGFIAQLCDGLYRSKDVAWLWDDEAALLEFADVPYLWVTSNARDYSTLQYQRRGRVRYQAAFSPASILQCLALLVADLYADPDVSRPSVDELWCYLLRLIPVNPQSSLHPLCAEV
jgi:hypothetical protein